MNTSAIPRAKMPGWNMNIITNTDKNSQRQMPGGAGIPRENGRVQQLPVEKNSW